MEYYNKVIQKQWFRQEHDFIWKITDFGRMRNNKQALELLNFGFEMGSSVGVASEWICFLNVEKIGKLYAIRPDVELLFDIPENAHFLTVIFIKVKNGKLLRVKADTYQDGKLSILDLFANDAELLEHPVDPDGSLSLNVHCYICNMQRIPQNISKNVLMGSLFTWFYENKFVKRFQADFQTMYIHGFDGGKKLGVELITKDGQKFLTNRAILGVRSPVFRSMFLTPMFEAEKGVAKIDDISGPAFEALLSFIYTGMLPGNWKEPEILEEFIYGAFKYMVEDLQKFFGRMMVCLCSEEEENVNKQNLKQLADMLNIKMEQDWNACLEKFIKEDCNSGVKAFFGQLKSKELEPRYLIAILGTGDHNLL